MTNDDAIPSIESAEQRLDHAVDAIRNMSQDRADEVAPRSTWFDQITPLRAVHAGFSRNVCLEAALRRAAFGGCARVRP